MLPEGMQLSHYQIQRPIGKSSTGEVYLAWDTHSNQQVVIKVIRTEMSISSTSEFKEATRLLREDIKTITASKHPHIIPIFDRGQENVSGVRLLLQLP